MCFYFVFSSLVVMANCYFLCRLICDEIRHLLTILFLFTFSYHLKYLFCGWWLSITAQHFSKMRYIREKPLFYRDMQNYTLAAALADMLCSAVILTWFSQVFLVHFFGLPFISGSSICSGLGLDCCFSLRFLTHFGCLVLADTVRFPGFYVSLYMCFITTGALDRRPQFHSSQACPK